MALAAGRLVVLGGAEMPKIRPFFCTLNIGAA